MTHKMFSIKMPERTRQQLDELTTAWGMTLTQVVVEAIDKLYAQYKEQKEQDQKK